MFPGVYRAKVSGCHTQAPLKMCFVVIPQVSGTTSQMAQLPTGLKTSPVIGSDVWVAFEGGNHNYPVVMNYQIGNTTIWKGTQAEYDLLTPDPDTLYVVTS